MFFLFSWKLERVTMEEAETRRTCFMQRTLPLKGTINPPWINSSQCQSVEAIFTPRFHIFSSSLLESTALRKKKAPSTPIVLSHLFITVTVIVSAKTMLAHTVSLLRSHKTCQLQRRRSKMCVCRKGGGRSQLKTAFIGRLRAA